MTGLMVDQVRDQVRKCTNCALAKGCRGPVPFSGPAPADIAIVGEAPGREEDKAVVPFVGLSGSLARKWIEPRFGEVAWLNVVSCFPNRTPTSREVDACRKNLMDQLNVIQPRLVLLFGGVAVGAFVDHRIGEIRGRWFKLGLGAGVEGHAPVWGMGTWHPAAILRNRSLEVEVLDDLRVFRESVGDNAIPPYVYRPCIKCGSCVGTHVTESGIAWCGKHWAWRVGQAGQGRKKKKQMEWEF